MKKTKKIPKFKSDAEIAAFWDTHDLTDYLADIEPATDVIFERPKKKTFSIHRFKKKAKVAPIVNRLSRVIKGKKATQEDYKKHLEEKYLNA